MTGFKPGAPPITLRSVKVVCLEPLAQVAVMLARISVCVVGVLFCNTVTSTTPVATVAVAVATEEGTLELSSYTNEAVRAVSVCDVAPS